MGLTILVSQPSSKASRKRGFCVRPGVRRLHERTRLCRQPGLACWQSTHLPELVVCLVPLFKRERDRACVRIDARHDALRCPQKAIIDALVLDNAPYLLNCNREY